MWSPGALLHRTASRLTFSSNVMLARITNKILLVFLQRFYKARSLGTWQLVPHLQALFRLPVSHSCALLSTLKCYCLLVALLHHLVVTTTHNFSIPLLPPTMPDHL